MLTKLYDFDVDKSRYVFLKELDLGGPIGRLWINYDKEIPTRMMQLAEYFDKYYQRTDYPPELEYPSILNGDVYHTIIGMNNIIPIFVLLESEYDWTLWLSAYNGFIRSVCDVTMHTIEQYLTPETEQKISEFKRLIDSIMESFTPIYRLAEIGQGYVDLLKASHYVMGELKSWQQSKPSAVRLSDSYLKAIGYYPPDYKEDTIFDKVDSNPNNQSGPMNSPPPPQNNDDRPPPDLHGPCHALNN